MIEVKGYCRIFGSNFSPSKAELSIGIHFILKNEPGDIGLIGRFKGEPIPYGSAEIEFTPYGDSADLIWVDSSILKFLEQHSSQLISAGADDITLHFDVYCVNDCNLELSRNILAKLGKLNVNVTISCYQDVEP